MRTVGQILKETREEKFYTLEEVEQAIKIRKEMLQALEADNYSKLPPSTFVQGFIKNYAKFLNLDSEKLLAIFRREFSEIKNKPYVMDAFANPPKERKFKITPGRVLGIAVSILIISFFVYLWFQYRQFSGSPNLSLNTPADQYTSSNSSITVEGKTDPEVKVFVNSQEIPTTNEGNFKQEIALSSEMNKITVTAVSKYGKKISLERTIYVKTSE